MPFIDMHDDRAPKRGDIVQTNLGNKRQRTWMILRVKRVRGHSRRYSLWMARWWELEPDFRMRLFRSAERAGGQRVINFYRYPAKKKKRIDFAMQGR
jgi:hypothetical protein